MHENATEILAQRFCRRCRHFYPIIWIHYIDRVNGNEREREWACGREGAGDSREGLRKKTRTASGTATFYWVMILVFLAFFSLLVCQWWTRLSRAILQICDKSSISRKKRFLRLDDPRNSFSIQSNSVHRPRQIDRRVGLFELDFIALALCPALPLSLLLYQFTTNKLAYLLAVSKKTSGIKSDDCYRRGQTTIGYELESDDHRDQQQVLR